MILNIISCCLERSSLSLIMGVTQKLHNLTESSILTRPFAVTAMVMTFLFAVYTLEFSTGIRSMPVCLVTFSATRQTPLPVSGQAWMTLQLSAAVDLFEAILISRLSVFEKAA